MFKRRVALLVAIAFLMTIIVPGFLSAPTKAIAASKKPIVFKIYWGDSNAEPVDVWKTPIGKKVEQITGVRLQFEFIVGSDEETKAGIMLASGDLPDLINAHNVVNKFIEAGALVPMDNYIAKYGKNIKKWYDTKALKKLKYPKDGHIYYLTPFREESDPLYSFAGFWLPIYVLKENKWPVVRDIDTYFKIVKDAVKKHPTYNGKPTIGFTALTDSWRIYVLMQQPLRLEGYPNDGGWLIDEKTGVVKDSYTMPYAKTYYKILNQMWNEGLLDKEMFSQNYDQYLAKISSGRVVGFYDERWQIQPAIDSLEKQKLYDRIPIAMPVLKKGVKRDKYNVVTMGTGAGISITKKCKDPVAAFKFLDRMAQEDILKLINWGIQGQDYYVKNGKMYKTAQQIQNYMNPDYRKKQGIGGNIWFAFPRPPFDWTYSDKSGKISWDYSDQALEARYKPYEKEVLKAYKIKSFKDLFSPTWNSPYGYGWDIKLPDDLQAIQNQADDLQRRYITKAIMAKPGEYDKIWNEYLSKMKKIPIKKVIDFRQKEIQRRLKEWN
ncbi:ABC transporter substrate-binding protein [Caldicellulosiruptor sp. DIB 104C]|uniref:ABC transporter substrate-binding protein n=1 Tax=Caldicellulosiruptor sp. DIB 104C TaxID=3019889 RepID=UPI0023066880|nr:ABC transporter substrate-binding protein [Caldicellulosiruptor sp. DIB 104C]